MGEVHDLVYHGGGGFIWSEVWDMPVSSRRYHIFKINEFLKKKAEAAPEAEAPAKPEPAPEPQPEAEAPASPEAEAEKPVIENLRADKLEGQKQTHH